MAEKDSSQTHNSSISLSMRMIIGLMEYKHERYAGFKLRQLYAKNNNLQKRLEYNTTIN